jgi:hypothetical protein
MSNDFWKDYEPEPTRAAPMTTERALDLALEALESVLANHNGAPVLPWIEARDAIKQARALDKKAENARELGLDYEPDYKVTVVDDQHPNGVPLEQWGSPAPVQEPVAKHYMDGGHLVYPTAQRQWVGLTDEEIEKLTVELRDIPVTLAFAIEAKLKEKNT